MADDGPLKIVYDRVQDVVQVFLEEQKLKAEYTPEYTQQQKNQSQIKNKDNYPIKYIEYKEN